MCASWLYTGRELVCNFHFWQWWSQGLNVITECFEKLFCQFFWLNKNFILICFMMYLTEIKHLTEISIWFQNQTVWPLLRKFIAEVHFRFMCYQTNYSKCILFSICFEFLDLFPARTLKIRLELTQIYWKWIM